MMSPFFTPDSTVFTTLSTDTEAQSRVSTRQDHSLGYRYVLW